MLESKIHRATVTACDLHHVGSITIERRGDTIIVLSCAGYDPEDLEHYTPRVVNVGAANRITAVDDQMATSTGAPAAA
jgi:aspartate 1-decarboxylase